MQEDSTLEKSMPKRKPPLIRIDLAGFISDALATIGAWALLLWLIAALIAAIRAIYLIGNVNLYLFGYDRGGICHL